jgi:hypothetical protein
MKFVRCAECGTELEIKRVALPKYGQIVDIIPQHICPSTPVQFNPTPNPLPVSGGQFVLKLNDLAKSSIPLPNAEGSELKDRRPDVVTSTAPKTIFDQIEAMKRE